MDLDELSNALRTAIQEYLNTPTQTYNVEIYAQPFGKDIEITLADITHDHGQYPKQHVIDFVVEKTEEWFPGKSVEVTNLSAENVLKPVSAHSASHMKIEGP